MLALTLTATEVTVTAFVKSLKNVSVVGIPHHENLSEPEASSVDSRPCHAVLQA